MTRRDRAEPLGHGEPLTLTAVLPSALDCRVSSATHGAAAAVEAFHCIESDWLFN